MNKLLMLYLIFSIPCVAFTIKHIYLLICMLIRCIKNPDILEKIKEDNLRHDEIYKM